MRRAWVFGIGLVAPVLVAGCFVSLGETNARPPGEGAGEAGPDAASDSETSDPRASSTCPPVTDDTLLGYWRFEEEDRSRVVVDCSGHGLDGVLAEGAVRRVPAHSGRGIDLDGKSGCFDLGTAPAFAFTGAPFTVTAWILVRTFNLSNGSSPRWFVGRAEFEDANYHGWGIGSHEPSGVEMKLFPEGRPFVSAQAAIPKDTFVHVGAVHAEGRVRIYTNGVLSAQLETADVPSSLARAHLWIGCRNTTEEPFDGVIDELRVYGRALAEAEIAVLAR